MATGLVFRTAKFRDQHQTVRSSRLPGFYLRFQNPLRVQDRQGKFRKLRHATTAPHCSQDSDSTSSRPKSDKSSICECLMFVQVAEELPTEEAEESVGKLWSAQYMAPGTLCAFGGAQVASSAGCPPFTHAVRFRFGSQAAASQFLTSEAVQGVLADDSTSTSQRNTTVLFEGRVASDLEAMFCRGSAWESGTEHAIVFKAASTATSEQIEEYLVQLAALAESSLAGALQCTYGKIQWSKGNIAGATHAMLTRFETKRQMQAFLRLPLCVAVVETPENFPVSAVLSFAYNIAPPNDSRSSAPQSNLL